MKVLLRVLVVLLVVLVCSLAVRRVSAQGGGVSVTQTFCLGTTPCVWTYHNDNSRDGVNPNETTFSPTTDFTQLQAVTYTTDGLIYAQPLFVASLYGSNQKVGSCASPSNSPINVVFVATENNSVYALEAPPFNPPVTNVCWQLNLNQSGETAIPYTSLPPANGVPCKTLTPWVGITGTPVIDVSVTPPILYVVSSHQNSDGTFVERLHAIDTTTGSELAGKDIGAALSGSGFKIIVENQRAGLALSHPSGSPNLANVYVAWASNCDYNSLGNYDGWLAGFQLNYNSLSSGFTLLGTFTSEPTTGQHNGGIWMAGGAPAVDGNGNVYIAVANGGVSPPSPTSGQWGNSVMKLSSSLAYQDFYTPNDWAQLDTGSGTNGICFASSCPPGPTHEIAGDTDMGTGGVVLLNNSSSPSELMSVGKQGMVYVVPYKASANGYMGGLDGGGYTGTTGSNPQSTDCSTTTGFPSPGSIVQCIEATNFQAGNINNGVRGNPVFWSVPNSTNQYLYPIGLNDYMYWYGYSPGSPGTFNTTSPPLSDHEFIPNGANPPVGGTASVTWNSGTGGGATTGVVWGLDSNFYGRPNPDGNGFASPALLYVYPAVPTGQTVTELWDSKKLTNNATLMPGAVKFTVPTVVDGYILIGGGSPGYFGTSSTLCPPPPPNNGVPTQPCDGQLTILGIAPK